MNDKKMYELLQKIDDRMDDIVDLVESHKHCDGKVMTSIYSKGVNQSIISIQEIEDACDVVDRFVDGENVFDTKLMSRDEYEAQKKRVEEKENGISK